MTLMATWRLRLGWYALYTSAMPPLPNRSKIWYCPSVVPTSLLIGRNYTEDGRNGVLVYWFIRILVYYTTTPLHQYTPYKRMAL